MKKPIFTLTKVICPHENMPEEIREAWFQGLEEWEMGNNQFVSWMVGSSSDFEGQAFKDTKKVDDWLLDNGFEENENVMILYWW